jgi:hypothetical protein
MVHRPERRCGARIAEGAAEAAAVVGDAREIRAEDLDEEESVIRSRTISEPGRAVSTSRVMNWMFSRNEGTPSASGVIRMSGGNAARICRASGSSSTKQPVTKLVSGPFAPTSSCMTALRESHRATSSKRTEVLRGWSRSTCPWPSGRTASRRRARRVARPSCLR